ncbi:MAG: ABC transporter permease [Candidatus Nanopelagicales bacterium]
MSAEATALSRRVAAPVVQPQSGSRFASRVWSACWPKLAAVGMALAIWQAVYLSGWRPPWVLPSPATTFSSLSQILQTSQFWQSLGTTMQRAVIGFLLAVLIGSVIGIAVSRVRVLRLAVGSMITGLQTMPSIAWFPLAILVFGLSEQAILFVVVLGAAPSAANGIISGIDHIPPQQLRLGRTLGARGWALYRNFVIPSAMPAVLTGLKQGWAFAWRSLMAGELLVTLGHYALGQQLSQARDVSDAPGLISYMIIILVIGMGVDSLFNAADLRLRQRRGLVER